jgi:amino acid transporter
LSDPAEIQPSAAHFITWRQAAIIGIGSMVGAGIFSLLGAAGEVAGAAVWLSFVFAGIIAAFQGYSFAKFGARYPSAGGMLEYVARGFGEGHVTGIMAWMIFSVNIIVTAMVAVSFGSYASTLFTNDSHVWAKLFAGLVVVAMTGVNIAGSRVVVRAQSAIVFVVIGILLVFAVVTIANMEPSLLAPSGYPPVRDIFASVALTFFAFLGFGIVTFTAKDLQEPSKQLPKAMYLALGTATVIYIAVSLGVFGTLTVAKVIASGPTALAVAAEPTLGRAGFWLMSVTGLFATAGATNAGLYPASGLSAHLAATGEFPPFLGRYLGGRASVGLLITGAGSLALALGFGLTAIASIGSAAALMIFLLITVAHLRVRSETGARTSILVLGILTTGLALLTFVFTTLVDEPASVTTLVAILVFSVVFDLWWKARRDAEPPREAEA